MKKRLKLIPWSVKFLFLIFSFSAQAQVCLTVKRFTNLTPFEMQRIEQLGNTLILEGMMKEHAQAFIERIADEYSSLPVPRSIEELNQFQISLGTLHRDLSITQKDIDTINLFLTKYKSQFLFAFHLTHSRVLEKILAGDESSGFLPYMRPSGKILGGFGIFVSDIPLNQMDGISARVVRDGLKGADALIVFKGQAAQVFSAFTVSQALGTVNHTNMFRAMSGTRVLSFKRLIIKKSKMLEDGKTLLVEEVEVVPVTIKEKIKGWMSVIFERPLLYAPSVAASIMLLTDILSISF